MTQKEYLLELFFTHGRMLTLGQILKTRLAAEYRARMSDLRRMGFKIFCNEDVKRPSRNIYILL